MRRLTMEEKKPDLNTFIMLEKATAWRDRTTDHICKALEDAKIPPQTWWLNVGH